MVFGEIASGLSLLDRLQKILNKWRGGTQAEPESIATRFVRLHESHGVHRNQIPRFLGCNLTLSDMQDDDFLLEKLSEEILVDTCRRFSIRREWLDGADSIIYPVHDFYKSPEEFSNFIDSIIEPEPVGRVSGILVAPEENKWGVNALLLLQETIDYIGDKPIYRYHICNDWAFRYWKARAYLASCVAIAWKRKIYIHGVTKPEEYINEYAYGESLLGWKGEGFWAIGHKDWTPEDMLDTPEVFLKDVDPEIDEYGLKSALNLWLELESRGLMDPGFPYSRKAFEDALLELKKY